MGEGVVPIQYMNGRRHYECLTERPVHEGSTFQGSKSRWSNRADGCNKPTTLPAKEGLSACKCEKSATGRQQTRATGLSFFLFRVTPEPKPDKGRDVDDDPWGHEEQKPWLVFAANRHDPPALNPSSCQSRRVDPMPVRGISQQLLFTACPLRI